MALLNLVRVSTATTGTSTLTLGSAVSGFLSMEDAGAIDGQAYDYAIEDGSPVARREIGTGVWNAGTATLTRATIRDSTSGGAAISIAGPAQVIVTPNRYTWRELLTEDRTYYVRTDGSDSNGGLVNDASGAWLTLQHAWDTITGTLDLGSNLVTIQVADGTYDGRVFLNTPPVGGIIDIVGNSSAPEAVVLTSSTVPHDQFGVVELSNLGPGLCRLRYVQVDAGAADACVYMYNKASWDLIRISVKNAAYGLYLESGAAGSGDLWRIRGTIGYCVYVDTGATLLLVGGSPVVTDAPALTSFASAHNCGVLQVVAHNFTGSATGPRYDADTNGVINTFGGGANFFPGDAPGSTATGGQYV